MNICCSALKAMDVLLCRVYKNFDPRAKIIREVAEEVFQIQGRDPLIDVAVELEKRARADDYFVKRNLYPNVDFYSGQALLCSLPQTFLGQRSSHVQNHHGFDWMLHRPFSAPQYNVGRALVCYVQAS